MKTIEQTRRELFEAWFESLNHRKPEIQYSECGHYFSDRRTEDAWQGFNAALDAVVIELPDTFANTGSLTSTAVIGYKRDVRAAIESTNLGLKFR